MYDFDLIVIGGGSAGLNAVKLAKGLGKKVALIEKRKLGGDCTWFGCVPSKALLRAAAIAHDTKHLGDFGLKAAGAIQINADNVMSHVRSVVEHDYQTIRPETFEQAGISVFFGSLQFIDNHKIRLNDFTISSDKFLICTGSRPFIPPTDGLSDISFLTNETIFDLKQLPRSMIILGGGPIGTEMACALSRLGVNITVIQKGPQILPKEEPEFAMQLAESLARESVKFQLDSIATGFAAQNDRITATVKDKNGRVLVVQADSLLVAVGRLPNIDNMALEKAGVEFYEKGLKVDDYLRTTAKNIYGAGDVVPPYLFTHIAEYEAIVATSNACLPFKRKVNYDNVLWCTFTDPELARAGLTEREAQQRYGGLIRTYRTEYKTADRAKTDLTENGIAKFICDPNDRLVGIHILGHSAVELMHEAQVTKSLGLPFRKIASIIHAYPSYSDVVRFAARKCYIDHLQNNFFIKLAKKFSSRKR
jgi:pyruvate/2-oxoglutarate dehydrogenase complex dihydrolipoamide dehydrogenase (E3) component